MWVWVYLGARPTKRVWKSTTLRSPLPYISYHCRLSLKPTIFSRICTMQRRVQCLLSFDGVQFQLSPSHLLLERKPCGPVPADVMIAVSEGRWIIHPDTGIGEGGPMAFIVVSWAGVNGVARAIHLVCAPRDVRIAIDKQSARGMEKFIKISSNLPRSLV